LRNSQLRRLLPAFTSVPPDHPQQKDASRLPEKSPRTHLIDLNAVTKAYQTDAGLFMALKGIDLHVEAGEFVASLFPALRAVRLTVTEALAYQ
jgi:hypothetical protein